MKSTKKRDAHVHTEEHDLKDLRPGEIQHHDPTEFCQRDAWQKKVKEQFLTRKTNSIHIRYHLDRFE